MRYVHHIIPEDRMVSPNLEDEKKLDMQNFVDFELYHGTSTFFLPYLKNGRDSPIDAQMLKSLCTELYSLINPTNQPYVKGDNLLFAGDFNSPGSIFFAFQEIANGYENTLYNYGDLYVTVGKRSAKRHALWSPFGSEILYFIDGSIKLLKDAAAIDREQEEMLIENHRPIFDILDQRHEPVIVTFHQVELDNLETGRGETYTEEQMQIDLPSFKNEQSGKNERRGNETSYAFRLKNPEVAKIKSVEMLTR